MIFVAWINERKGVPIEYYTHHLKTNEEEEEERNYYPAADQGIL